MPPISTGGVGLGAPRLNRPPQRQPQNFSSPPQGPAGAGGLGAFGALTQRPRPPRSNFSGLQSGLAGVGGGLLASSGVRPRLNPGVVGSALLGTRSGGGPNSGPGAIATSAPPPAAPNPADTFNIGLVPADEDARAAAQATYGTDTGSYLAALRDSAIRYGDPNIMSALGLGTTVNPSSALAMAAMKAQQQNQVDDQARERAGTFFSSLHMDDRSRVAGTQQQEQASAYQDYQNALQDYNTRMSAALDALNEASNRANTDERQNAINNLPTAATAAGGFQGGSSNVTSRVPIGASRPGSALRGAGRLTAPRLPRSPGGHVGSGRTGGVAANRPGRVTPVRPGTHRISGGRGRR